VGEGRSWDDLAADVGVGVDDLRSFEARKRGSVFAAALGTSYAQTSPTTGRGMRIDRRDLRHKIAPGAWLQTAWSEEVAKVVMAAVPLEPLQ
jgi:hypothetical protein